MKSNQLLRPVILSSLFLSMLLGSSLLRAADPEMDKTTEEAAKAAPFSISYRPPQMGSPETRIGGGTRGSMDENIICEVIAPPHTGYTSVPSPVLFWYTNASTSRFEFALIDDDAIEPLLELKMGEKAMTGFHQLDLSSHNVSLIPGKVYQWSVAVMASNGDRSADIVASGTVTYQQPASSLEAALSGESGLGLTRLYAESGYWYDAFASLWTPESQTQSAENTRALMDLIQQVGLGQVATAIAVPK
jgi:hypothetical protein